MNLNVCRICFRSSHLQNIFKDPFDISDRIHFCTSVRPNKNDGGPQMICRNCINNLNIAFKFKKMALHNEKKLKWVLSGYEVAFQKYLHAKMESLHSTQSKLKQGILKQTGDVDNICSDIKSDIIRGKFEFKEEAKIDKSRFHVNKIDFVEGVEFTTDLSNNILVNKTMLTEAIQDVIKSLNLGSLLNNKHNLKSGVHVKDCEKYDKMKESLKDFFEFEENGEDLFEDDNEDTENEDFNDDTIFFNDKKSYDNHLNDFMSEIGSDQDFNSLNDSPICSKDLLDYN